MRDYRFHLQFKPYYIYKRKLPAKILKKTMQNPQFLFFYLKA